MMASRATGSGCIFCGRGEERMVARNDLAYAVGDTSPVTPLHTLILSRRHIATITIERS
jgi:ATP adenylyltransferase